MRRDMDETVRHVSDPALALRILGIQRDLASRLRTSMPLCEALRIILESALQIDEFDSGGIYLRDTRTGQLDLITSKGISDEMTREVSLYRPEHPRARLVATGRPIYAQYSPENPRAHLVPSGEPLHAADQAFPLEARPQKEMQEGLRGLAVVPIVFEGEVIGALNLASHTLQEFSACSKDAIELFVTFIAATIKYIQALELAQERQKNLEVLFEASEDFFFVIDLQGHILHTNPAISRRLGYTSEELRRLTVMDLHHPQRTREALEILHAVLSKERACCPLAMRTRDGQTIPVETRLSRCRWNEQEVIFGISRDVSERLHAEEALREANENLERRVEARTVELNRTTQQLLGILAHTPSLVSLFDREGHWLRASASMIRLLGARREEELIGKRFSALLSPSSAAEFQARVDLVLCTGKPHETEDRQVLSGDEHIYQSVLFPLLEPDGRIEMLCCMGTDISDRLQVEEERRRTQEQLLRADKMISLGVLVSGVAHEINNPNQFIMTHTYPLKKIWEDAVPILDRYFRENGDFMLGGKEYSSRRDQVPQMFLDLLSGSQRIRNIVDELRAYSREEQPDFFSPVDLNKVVQSAIALVGNLLQKATSRFSACCREELPSIRGSYQRLEQVVINLIKNSCQALPDPRSAIRVSTDYREDQHAVLLEIVDEGAGMSEVVLRQCRDPFFTTRWNSGGTGLGLPICDRIIEEHGGTLDIRSTPGSGTRILIQLPAVERPATVTEGVPA